MTNVIKLDNVEKSFSTFKLGPLDLKIKRGTITGLIGENGAGKSTTINLLLDTIKKDSGEIEIFGKDSEKLSENDRYRIGFVYDDLYLPENMDLGEIEKFHSLLYKDFWEEDKFYEYVDKFSLPENQTIKNFSRGMKTKLSLALALSHKAELLLLDEPTSGLDPVVRDDFLEILLDYIQNEENTVLISSHILSDLEKVADYIAFIHKGDLLFNEEKDRLIETYGLASLNDEEFESIDKNAVVAVRKHKFGQECLLIRQRVPESIELDNPSIEDIMVFLIKEAYNESLDI